MNAPLPSHRTRLGRLFLFCSVAITGAALLLPLLASSQLPVIRFVRDPDLAPDFKLKDLSGNELSLEGSRGRVILLNFWATWCGPCRAEIPSLIALQNRYKDRLRIIGMDVDDEDENMVREVVESEGINYPVAIGPLQIRMAYGGITALPTVFVINAEGRVVQKHVGLFNPALYETEVRALLDLPVAARIETFVDTGEVFLKNASRATTLPGVDMTKLTPDQHLVALHKFNAENCTCGCKFTLAQCRIYDHNCQISQDRTAEIVKKIAAAAVEPEKAKSESTAPTPVPANSPVPNSASPNPASPDAAKPDTGKP